MPAWLALSWALTLGYCPEYNSQLAYLVSEKSIAYEHAGSLVQTLHLQANVFDHIRVWNDLETRDTFNATPFGFQPFSATYLIGGELYASGLTIGIKHSCTHSVISGFMALPSPALGGNETQIYLRIEGK